MTRKYRNGFDKYNGQSILFYDDLKVESERYSVGSQNQMRYDDLLALLDGYRNQMDCRYSNNFALWTTVEVTSIFPPDELYERFDIMDRERDSYEQLRRRIDMLVFHYKDKDGNLAEREMPMAEYVNYHALQIDLSELLWVEPLDYGDGVAPDVDADLAALFEWDT